VDIRISNFAIIPLYIVSFVLFAFQYYRVNPERRILNLRFLMMMGAVVLLFTAGALNAPSLSPVFFLLALIWLGLALFLLRFLPPPRT
jgi:multisubunit Na+/H+ antiporter MnhB subunit